MIWSVSDSGKVEVRMRSEGEEAIRVARANGGRLIANIITDLSENLGIEVAYDETRFSFSTSRPEVTLIWKSVVPEDKVSMMREYLARLAESQHPVMGEVVESPDQ